MRRVCTFFVLVWRRIKIIWGNYELHFLRYLNLQPNGQTQMSEINWYLFEQIFFFENHFISDYSLVGFVLFGWHFLCVWAQFHVYEHSRVHQSNKRAIVLLELDAHQPVKPPFFALDTLQLNRIGSAVYCCIPPPTSSSLCTFTTHVSATFIHTIHFYSS